MRTSNNGPRHLVIVLLRTYLPTTYIADANVKERNAKVVKLELAPFLCLIVGGWEMHAWLSRAEMLKTLAGVVKIGVKNNY